MGLRERIERELEAALRAVEADEGGQVNVARRVNAVVVRNVGAGTAAAASEQTAPIVQTPGDGKADG